MASLPYPRRPLDNSPTDGTDAHRWFGCVGFSHGIHRSFWRKIFSHRFHRCPQIRRVWHPCHTHATLCQSSHGIHRIHRNFWRRRASHRFHRCSQIRRVWHPCHTHATLCQSSHGFHRIHRNFWRRRASHGFHRCPQMVRLRKVLWEDSLVAAWVWQDAIPSYSLHCLFCWCSSCSGKRQGRAETAAPP